jgi:hypothetical protein
MFIDVKDTPYPLDKEIAMTHLPPHPRALTIAHEDVVKVALQLKDNLITRGEMNAQMLSIVIDMKVALRQEFIGEVQDKLSDIEQLFTDVQGSIEEMDYLTLFQPE